jgi:hypothetical protein
MKKICVVFLPRKFDKVSQNKLMFMQCNSSNKFREVTKNLSLDGQKYVNGLCWLHALWPFQAFFFLPEFAYFGHVNYDLENL